MLYFLSQFEYVISELRLFQYITVRTLGAAATGFFLMWLITPSWIKKLRSMKFTVSKSDNRVGVERPNSENKIPTMGGLVIIISTFVSTFLWANPLNLYVVLTVGTLIAMGVIGFFDDYWKIKRKKGLSVRGKFILQLIWTIFIFMILWNDTESQQRLRDLMVPFNKYPLFDLGLIGSFIFVLVVYDSALSRYVSNKD